MIKNTSCLLALAASVASALVAMPSQAQTATENNITASSQSYVTNENLISNLKKSKAVNKNKTTEISQAETSTVNIPKPIRERIPVYSRIGFGLKQ
ncbi:MAG: hypothetical protein AAF630_09415 [Cyanobacteria bacterium P01_C01_bin.38]